MNGNMQDKIIAMLSPEAAERLLAAEFTEQKHAQELESWMCRINSLQSQISELQRELKVVQRKAKP